MKRMASAVKKLNAKDISTKRRSSPIRGSSRFAVCIDNADFPVALQRHKIYRVLPDRDAARDGDLRVVDDSGEDYLYPANRFVTVQLPAAVRASL